MRHKWSALSIILGFVPTFLGQIAPKNDFPLTVQIEAAQDAMLKLPTEQEAEDARMGVAPPGLLMFRGSINGEHHWYFTCRKEAAGRESVPCTLIPTGEYRGRWVHDSHLLEIVGGAADASVSRFLMVGSDPKSPVPPDDAIERIAPYDFDVALPNGMSRDGFPFLIHVYGSVSMQLPVGTRPGHTTCTQSTWNPNQTTVNCRSSPPTEIHKGYVTVDFSIGNVGIASMNCEAKWRWSHCSVLEPGFYYARAGKDRLAVLTHEEDGSPREVSFAVNMPAEPSARSPIK